MIKYFAEDMRDDLGSSISVNTEDRYSDIEARSGEVQSDSDSDKEPLKSPDRRASARLGSQVSVHQNTVSCFPKWLGLLDCF